MRSLIEKAGVEHHLFEMENRKTIQKLRISSNRHQILRVDFEDEFTAFDSKVFNQKVIGELETCSLLIVSDYAKGTLGDIETLINEAKDRGIPVLVDPKGASFDKYRNATVLKPNRAEFELIVGRCANDAEICRKGEDLRRDLNLEALLLTLSDKGMLLFEKSKAPLAVPAITHEVVDVTGAGDTVIAWLARGLVVGKSLSESVVRANVASSIAVTKSGTSTISLSEVMACESLDLGHPAVFSLSEFVSARRAAGETIVFTNGCFDILHEGHIKYLEEAKKLGDRLIVAVNDDESVKALKGDSRPINSLSSRVSVLNALSSTDFIISFGDETPIALIKEISPDVLVKGGDYKDKEIVGSDYVLELDGIVRTIDFVQGFSTTTIIDAIRATDSH